MRARDVFRCGTIAGLAMIPFAMVFRFYGLRINEYGRKTLVLLLGEQPPRLHYLLSFIQHIIISWFVAIPLLLLLAAISNRRSRVLVGAVYGLAFYVVVNSLLLPFAFGDPTPWTLGLGTIYPSVVVHLVFGITVALTAPQASGLDGRGVFAHASLGQRRNDV